MKSKKTYVQLYSNWRRLILIPVILPLLALGAIGQFAYKSLIYIGEAGCQLRRMDTTPRWVQIMIEWVQENDR